MINAGMVAVMHAGIPVHQPVYALDFFSEWDANRDAWITEPIAFPSHEARSEKNTLEALARPQLLGRLQQPISSNRTASKNQKERLWATFVFQRNVNGEMVLVLHQAKGTYSGSHFDRVAAFARQYILEETMDMEAKQNYEIMSCIRRVFQGNFTNK